MIKKMMVVGAVMAILGVIGGFGTTIMNKGIIASSIGFSSALAILFGIIIFMVAFFTEEVEDS